LAFLSNVWAERETVANSALTKVRKLTLVHAGSVAAFVTNALLMFKSNATTGDYHDQMNSESYTK
jgi:hypothetical protein